MPEPDQIPIFTLFGETDHFPDVVHLERIKDRAPNHDWKIAPHRHMQMAQVFILKDGRAVVDGQTYHVTNQTVLFIPPRVVHGFSFPPGTEGIVLSFPSSILRSIAPGQPQLLQNLARPVVFPPQPAFVRLIDSLIDAISAPSPYRTQAIVGISHAVLAGIASVAPSENAGPSQDRLAQFDRLISDHISKGLRPQDYAKALSVSTGHLSRLCREGKGISTSDYIASAVMEEACRLLAFTQMSVAQVGYRLSFSDPSYFTRRFRKIRGQTPQAYRKAVWG